MKLLFSITKKDFDLTWFSGTGAGGQHRNKHQNCCRLFHRDSGAVATGQSNRERPANQKEALDALVKTKEFRIWLAKKINMISTGKSIEDLVNEAMNENNIKIEIQSDGKWKEEN